jgi:hypothetical protein
METEGEGASGDCGSDPSCVGAVGPDTLTSADAGLQEAQDALDDPPLTVLSISAVTVSVRHARWTVHKCPAESFMGSSLMGMLSNVLTMFAHPGFGVDQAGTYQMVPGLIQFLCQYGSADNYWYQVTKGKQYVQDPNDIAFFGDDAEMEYTLGLSGTLADSELKSAVANMAIGDASVGIGSVVADLAQGPLQSTLFGRFASAQGGGFPGFLNDPVTPYA